MAMVMQTATQLPEPLADLAADFAGWHIWRGRDGRGAPKGWYATRQRRLRVEELDAGLTGMLSADDAESLRGQLTQQQVVEQRMAAGAL
jgi:hypothetical protein